MEDVGLDYLYLDNDAWLMFLQDMHVRLGNGLVLEQIQGDSIASQLYTLHSLARKMRTKIVNRIWQWPSSRASLTMEEDYQGVMAELLDMVEIMSRVAHDVCFDLPQITAENASVASEEMDLAEYTRRMEFRNFGNRLGMLFQQADELLDICERKRTEQQKARVALKSSLKPPMVRSEISFKAQLQADMIRDIEKLRVARQDERDKHDDVMETPRRILDEMRAIILA